MHGTWAGLRGQRGRKGGFGVIWPRLPGMVRGVQVDEDGGGNGREGRASDLWNNGAEVSRTVVYLSTLA